MLFLEKENAFDYAHLEHKSFSELFALKHRTERQLDALRLWEPLFGWIGDAVYCAWVGRNVRCIENLEKVRREILRRKRRAKRAGVSVFAFDGKCLYIQEKKPA